MICILHCVPTTKSQVIFHHHIFGSLYFLLYPHPYPSANHHTVVCVYEFHFYIPHMSWIIWFLAYSDLFFLVWYSQGPSILSQRAVFHLFYGWVVFHSIHVPIFFIQLSTEGHFGCFRVLATAKTCCNNMLQWTWGSIYLCKLMLSSFWSRHSEEVFLGHMVTLFLIFSGSTILFSIVVVPLYIPTISEWGFLCLHNLSSTWYYLSCW